MIEATCSACGTLNRIAEADVPVGAKFVNCSSCKSRVTVPAGATVPKLPSLAAPPKLPAIPGSKTVLPAKPFMPELPKAAGGQNDTIDLADLPAPKRTSALGGEQSRPAPKSGLAAAGVSDLPAPKARALPVSPLAMPSSLDLDDLLAPVGSSVGGGVVDLPAPKGPAGITDLPAPRTAQRGISDLPAPKAPAGIVDLPAPKTPQRGIIDLPAPKGGPPSIVDLPAPKTPQRGIVDLPAPKGPSGITDLPMPKGPSGITDLPMPKGPSGITDLPMPKGPSGITDLPQPKSPGNLPAPKGFFDDLPQPAGNQAQTRTSDLAPKGFFDDLPGTTGGQTTKAVAPKGFFDDIPGTGSAGNKSTDVAPKQASTDVAPKGFFDDVASPSGRAEPPIRPSVAKGFFDDIPGVAIETPANTTNDIAREEAPELDLELAPPSGGDPTPPPIAPARAPARQTASPTKANGQFDDLDLSSPTALPPPKQMDQGTRAQTTNNAGSTAQRDSLAKSGDMLLELEGEQPARPGEKLAPKRPEPKTKPEVVASPTAKRKKKIIAGAVVAVLALGGVGGVLYMRRQAAQERADQLENQVKLARTALVASDPGHWSRAFGAANQALQIDDKHVPAIALAAEASMAGALDDGVNYDARIGLGKRLIKGALDANLNGPEMIRASALQAITSAPAITDKLELLHKQAPKDADLTLYLAWGLALKGDHANAIKIFDELVGGPLKLSALYGRGSSKLELADLDGATADFNAVLADARDHLGAMVGLAAALPPSKVAQQESDLNGIIHRKDFATSDTRVRVHANILLGDDAQRSGRLDVARASFRAALAVAATDVHAMAGLAEVELRDGKLDAAKELTDKAVRISPNDARAQLAASELSIRMNNLTDATQRLGLLANRQPPLAPLEEARLHLLTGALHEARLENDAAIDEYIAGAKVAGELDLAPTMAAVRKLTEMAKLATEQKDLKRAADLRERSDSLLAPLADKAKGDPQLALSLGVAYLQTDTADKAEPLLRSAAEARPNDPDPSFQLGKALARLGRLDEAIVVLKKARALDATRIEFGFELGRTYEQAGNDTEAGKLYDALDSATDVPIEMRGRACRFYGRIGKIDKARAQGDAIAKIDVNDPAGLYCRGEGALLDKKGEVARSLFSQAVSGDVANAQYLDAQGRAAELVVEQAGDTKFEDEALRVYQLAHSVDPKMLNPIVGQGRIYTIRKEWLKVTEVLGAADKLKPGDPDIAYMMGVASQSLGQKPIAIAWLEQAARERPTADIFWRVGSMWFDLNDVAKMQVAYRRAIGLAEEEEKATGKILPWYKDVLYAYGDTLDEVSKCAVWAKFVDKNPEDGQHKSTARQYVATRCH